MQLDGQFDWLKFDTLDFGTIAHVIALKLSMIPLVQKMSKYNQSRWPSNCTCFHGHHVMRNSSIEPHWESTGGPNKKCPPGKRPCCWAANTRFSNSSLFVSSMFRIRAVIKLPVPRLLPSRISWTQSVSSSAVLRKTSRPSISFPWAVLRLVARSGGRHSTAKKKKQKKNTRNNETIFAPSSRRARGSTDDYCTATF